MKLKHLKNLLSKEDKKKFYQLILMSLLNFIIEIGAISSLAIIGSLLINNNNIIKSRKINYAPHHKK